MMVIPIALKALIIILLTFMTLLSPVQLAKRALIAHNNRIKQMPQQLLAIGNAGSNFCVHSAKDSAGHLLYSMDVAANIKP